MSETLQGVGFEIHSNLPREGPGDNESTKRAFFMLSALPTAPNILDIGCGPGIQTIQIAEMTNGSVTGLDYERKFLDALEKNAQAKGVGEKIKAIQGSMFELTFEPNTFDLIWSEGAIYIIGFEKGLTEWKRFIKDKGYLVVTHISWLKSDIPEEPKNFWSLAYPSITSIENNLQIAEKCGYHNVGHFILPTSAWWDDYYTPMEKKLIMLKNKYKGDEATLAKIAESQQEIDVYRKYSDCYGYVFYILQNEIS